MIVRNASLVNPEKSERDASKMDSAEANVNHVKPILRRSEHSKIRRARIRTDARSAPYAVGMNMRRYLALLRQTRCVLPVAPAKRAASLLGARAHRLANARY